MDKVFTLDEVAAALLMTRRAVIKIAKRHGLCMINGRTFTFTAGDVEGIKKAMRPNPEAPCSVTVRGHVDRPTTINSVSPKLRKLFLQRTNKPWAKKLLKEEFGE